MPGFLQNPAASSARSYFLQRTRTVVADPVRTLVSRPFSLSRPKARYRDADNMRSLDLREK